MLVYICLKFSVQTTTTKLLLIHTVNFNNNYNKDFMGRWQKMAEI